MLQYRIRESEEFEREMGEREGETLKCIILLQNGKMCHFLSQNLRILKYGLRAEISIPITFQ